MKDSPDNVLKGIFWMLAANGCFAIMAASTKMASGRLSAAEIIFVRSAASSVVLALWIARSGLSWTGKNPAILSLRGIIGFVALFLYFWCLPKIDLGTAVMLNYTAPIFAVIVSVIFFHEKISSAIKTAILGSFIGVYLLVSPHWQPEFLPLLAGLLSGCFAGIVHVLIRQTHREEQPITIIFYFTLTATIGSWLLLWKYPWIGPTPMEWFWLGIITLSSFVGQLLLTHSLKAAPVSVVSPFGYITPVLGLILGWLFWKEIPTPLSLVGSAIVIICGFVMFKTPAEESRKNPFLLR